MELHSHTQGLHQRWAKWRAAATAPHLLLKAARVHRLCPRANSIAVVVVVVVVGVGGQDGRGIEAPEDDDAILSPPVLVIFPKTSTSLIFFTP
jgi:hypothetical protein